MTAQNGPHAELEHAQQSWVELHHDLDILEIVTELDHAEEFCQFRQAYHAQHFVCAESVDRLLVIDGRQQDQIERERACEALVRHRPY